MIPKIVHYCWFGPKNKPHSFKKYLKTWQKNLPGYVFKEWNENTFDVYSVPFTRDAYLSGKFAFVSDYVRMLALYEDGGVYLDTDVEVLKPFDDLLVLPAFIGYDDQALCTAVIGAEKGNSLIEKCLEYYDEAKFDKDCLIPNPKIIAEVLGTYDYQLDYKRGVVGNVLHVFPIDYFAVKAFRDLSIHLSENSYSIHHYAASWFTPVGRFYRGFLNLLGVRGRILFFRFVAFLKKMKIL